MPNLKDSAHRLLQRHNSWANPKPEAFSQEQCDKEKRFISEYQDYKRPLSPHSIAKDPRNKELGSSSRQLRIGDFKLLQTLGTGTFARVWLACIQGSQEDKVFAVKILRKTDVIKLKQVEHIQNERDALAKVAGHPFIITLITSFSDRDCLYMVLDYCPGGEIFSYLRRNKKFNEEISRFYAAEIVLIMEFLHDIENIAYRDLKPENILLDADGHLKLVDFGFAKRLQNRETYTLCGTPEYLAPEVIRNSGHGTAVDWWALGILIYEFLVGQPPFWNQNPMKIYELICAGKVKYPSHLSHDAKDIIGKLLTVNPSDRLGNIGGTAKVKDHAFFKEIDWKALYNREMKGPIIPKIHGSADASCFEIYDPEPQRASTYTKDMAHKYDHEFKDF